MVFYNKEYLDNKQFLDKRKQDRKQEYLEESRDRLKRIIEKKITTIFIGAISSLEKHFGQLWGFGKKPEELTEKEKKFLEVWNIIRDEILNKGNHNLRSVLQELDQYEFAWMRYQTNLKGQTIDDKKAVEKYFSNLKGASDLYG